MSLVGSRARKTVVHVWAKSSHRNPDKLYVSSPFGDNTTDQRLIIDERIVVLEHRDNRNRVPLVHELRKPRGPELQLA